MTTNSRTSSPHAVANDLNISFIEEMPLGDVGHGRGNTYFSTQEALVPSPTGSSWCPRWRRRVARPATGAFWHRHTRRLHLSAQPQFLRYLQSRAHYRAQGNFIPASARMMQ